MPVLSLCLNDLSSLHLVKQAFLKRKGRGFYQIEEEKKIVVGAILDEVDDEIVAFFSQWGEVNCYSEDIDWNEQWNKQLLWVGKKCVLLKAGPGFGDASHTTTKLIISLMSGEKKLIDMGCGSGVLSCVAFAMGASQVHSIDIDSLALTHCRENLEANSMSSAFVASSLDDSSAFQGATLLMNMIESEQRQVFNRYHQYLNLLEKVVISGILYKDKGRYQQLFHYYFQDWELDKEFTEGEWWAARYIKKAQTDSLGFFQ